MSNFEIAVIILVILIVIAFLSNFISKKSNEAEDINDDSMTENSSEEIQYSNTDVSEDEEAEEERKKAIRKIKADQMLEYINMRGNSHKKTDEIRAEKNILIPQLLVLSKELIFKGVPSYVFNRAEMLYDKYTNAVLKFEEIQKNKSSLDVEISPEEVEFINRIENMQSELETQIVYLIDDIAMTGIFNDYYEQAGEDEQLDELAYIVAELDFLQEDIDIRWSAENYGIEDIE